MIYVGTSGYSYDDWIGNFYDVGVKKGQMLQEYARKFHFVEIDSTYYSMPNVFMCYNLALKTPDDFKFTVKLHGSMTHSRDNDVNTCRDFCTALSPLVESKKLGCLVAQFPYSYHMNDANIDYLKRLKANFGSLPLSVEFRNDRWMDAGIYKMLSEEGIGFICVDEPDLDGLVKPEVIVTSNIGYVRFHGRNASKWYNHKESYERYDYLYNEDTLKEWVPGIEFIDDNTDITFIAFNNHFRGQGAVNAGMLQRLLDENY